MKSGVDHSLPPGSLAFPVGLRITLLSASHRRAADLHQRIEYRLQINAERLIAFSTSAVAVCC